MEMVVNVKRMRMCCKHVDGVSLHTYIHKYSDFLVAMISVVLAQARPNYSLFILLFHINSYIPTASMYNHGKEVV